MVIMLMDVCGDGSGPVQVNCECKLVGGRSALNIFMLPFGMMVDEIYFIFLYSGTMQFEELFVMVLCYYILYPIKASRFSTIIWSTQRMGTKLTEDIKPSKYIFY